MASEEEVAGVIDQHIQALEASFNLLCQRFHLRKDGEIGAEKYDVRVSCFLLDELSYFLAAFLLSPVQDDLVTLRSQSQGGCFANTVGRAGDEDGFNP